MRWIISLFIGLLGNSFLWYQSRLPLNPPKHLDIEVDWRRIAKSDTAFVFTNSDTLIEHEMWLLRDTQSNPLLYYSDIQTPVCIDGLCKPVYIELYWDLVGQYVGYGVYESQLLTKFDHETFKEVDYLKLHELLLNPHSIMDRKSVTDLYDVGKEREKAITFKGVEVDGISGATKKEIKNSIVEGALYSCYTLWHLAYKDGAKKIGQKLPEIYTDSLANQFLQSNRPAYQQYALKQLSDADFQEKIPFIVPILKNGNPLTRAYILKKLPKPLFSNPLVIKELYQYFSAFDLNAKTILVNNLVYSRPIAAEFLSSQLKAFSKNQLKQFLQHLKNKPSFQTEIVIQHLKKYTSNKDATYGYLVKEFFPKKER